MLDSAAVLDKSEANDEIPPLLNPKVLETFQSYEGYRTADPFPHIVIDGLFNDAALRALLSEWRLGTHGDGDKHDDNNTTIKKVATNWKTPLGPKTKYYLDELHGPIWLRAMEKVTGINGLIGDPYRLGGGLHATQAGGKLAMHADFNKHPLFKLDRRLNLLVYLNEGWTEENGGYLELWDQEMKACVKRVLPIFNRTVIFSTNSTSFHGQPEPIVGPPSLWRKSIAIYYYSNGRPDEGLPLGTPEVHETLWQKRPGHDHY